MTELKKIVVWNSFAVLHILEAEKIFNETLFNGLRGVLPTKIAGYYLEKSQGTTYGNRGVLPIKIAEYYLLFLQGTTYFFPGYYLLFCGVLPTFLRGTTYFSAGYYLRSTHPHGSSTADLFISLLWVPKVLEVVLFCSTFNYFPHTRRRRFGCQKDV